MRAIKVRALRGVIAGPGHELQAGEVGKVAPLTASILVDCGAVELIDSNDEPLLREAVRAESLRIVREARQRPMPSLDDGRWQPIGY
jgi:hypothetical protein